MLARRRPVALPHAAQRRAGVAAGGGALARALVRVVARLTRRHPAVVAGEAESLRPPYAPLVRAVGLLLAGDVAAAARTLRTVARPRRPAGLAGGC